MESTRAPEPSPAPTLATPHFPGFFPSTPGDDAYSQQEGPLEQAGRDLPNTSSGSVILGAAAGILLGGPVGAAMGASLAGLYNIEGEALAARHLGGKSVDDKEPVVTPQEQALSDTPIGREVGGTVPVAVLAGAAGGGVMEFEAPEVKTEAEPVDAAGVQVEEASGVTTPTQARTPTEELKEDEGLSKQDKVLLGAAGAGLAAGGVGAAALAGDTETTKSPYASPTPEAVVTEVRSIEDAFASAQGVEDIEREAIPSDTTSTSEFSTQTTRGSGSDIPLQDSFFHGELARRPSLTSQFSDSTVASSMFIPDDDVTDRYDQQRAVLPPLLTTEPQGDEPHYPKLDATTLAGPAVTGVVVGFALDSDTTEKQDFAHLSQENLPPPTAQAMQPNSSWKDETLLALGTGAGVAAGVGAAAGVAESRGPPPSLPHSPGRQDLAHAGETQRSLHERAGTPEAQHHQHHQHHQHPHHQHAAREESPSRSYVSSAAPDSPSRSYIPEPPTSPTPATNLVEHSPHLKIATRRDSVGHKRLHKDSLNRRRSASIGSESPGGGSSVAGGNASPRTEGEGIWNSSVAQVVNDETEQRGQRPALMTIESEDRREHIMDRMVGVQDPAHAQTYAQQSRHTSSTGSEVIPPTQDSPSVNRKLTKNRRSSSVPRRSGDHVRGMSGEHEGSPKKGFLSKVFGHSKKESQ